MTPAEAEELRVRSARQQAKRDALARLPALPAGLLERLRAERDGQPAGHPQGDATGGKEVAGR